MNRGPFQTLILTLFFAALLSCGKKIEPDRRWPSFPVSIYAHQSLASQPLALSFLNESMKYWEKEAGRSLFVYDGVWNGQEPPFSGPPNNPTHLYGNVVMMENPHYLPPSDIGVTFLQYSESGIQSAAIFLSAEIPYGSDRSQSLLKLVLTHELGHFLGLNHSTDKKNIMFPTLQAGMDVWSLDVDEFELRGLTQ